MLCLLLLCQRKAIFTVADNSSFYEWVVLMAIAQLAMYLVSKYGKCATPHLMRLCHNFLKARQLGASEWRKLIFLWLTEQPTSNSLQIFFSKKMTLLVGDSHIVLPSSWWRSKVRKKSDRARLIQSSSLEIKRILSTTAAQHSTEENHRVTQKTGRKDTEQLALWKLAEDLQSGL